jgi:hypothetical protein
MLIILILILYLPIVGWLMSGFLIFIIIILGGAFLALVVLFTIAMLIYVTFSKFLEQIL